MILASLYLALLAGPQDRVRVEHDNLVLATDCTLEIPGWVADADQNGVIHIATPGLTVDFAGLELRGAAPGVLPDAYTGLGVVVTAPGVTLRNARVSGFKVGILAQGADGLVLEDCDVSDNYRTRLLSTPAAEDGADWLWPHANDAKEWRTNYGAGICIESSSSVSVRRCRAREGQNALILDRVTGSSIYDNDFSFLSGWGIAMWRSSDNTISRNALDFCVRGYSHGVYNRGQDSAGLLMFEQCSDNRILENSITHGGDGVFGFAGKEALGEVPGPEGFDCTRKGCNDNTFMDNDLSYAAAHGLEMTFSFGNQVVKNAFRENAICGIWGGYSQEMLIALNEFQGNGSAGYGLERGAVNIEHSVKNTIGLNRFKDNVCGVHLWWDADEGLAATPWALANSTSCEGNAIEVNGFRGDELAIHLRECSETYVFDNNFVEVAEAIRSDHGETNEEWHGPGSSASFYPIRFDPEAMGESRPVGARAVLGGREHMVMTEWGPYDWVAPLLVRGERRAAAQVWRWLGNEALESVTAEGEVQVAREEGPDGVRVLVSADAESALVPYTLVARSAAGEQRRSGVASSVTWTVRVFPWTVDPREDEAGWRAEGDGATRFELSELDLAFGMAGASQLAGVPAAIAEAGLPGDRFGTLAEARVQLPAGRWKVSLTSDDGVRVLLDGEVLLEDWTWHAPRTGAEVIELAEARTLSFEVAHFELDGFAVLKLSIEPAE